MPRVKSTPKRISDKAAGTIARAIQKRAQASEARRKTAPTKVLKMGNIGNKLAFPERYVCWLETSLQGHVTLDATNGNFTTVNVTSIADPFNTTYSFTAAANVYDWAGVLAQGNSISNDPIGVGTINQIYKNYKVMRYVIEMTVHPQISTDSALLIGYPSGDEQIPSSVAGNVNSFVMCGQSGNKQKWVSNASDITKNKVVIRGSCWDLLGQRQDQWKDQPSTAIGTTTAFPLAGYVSFFCQIAGTAAGQAVTACQIKLKQEVEFTDINQQIN